ncbi:TPA: hypothetical protein RQN23_002926 [Aeromonas veronii]|nr:hypothetical protein [Aeromonas veronii]
MKNTEMSELDKWLEKLDALPLECDGMSRVISHLLSKQNIEHEISVGSLQCQSGKIPLHYWITLGNGTLLDLRARMWLGNNDGIPHGLIKQGEYNYIKKGSINTINDDFLFMILSERKPADFQPIPKLDFEMKAANLPSQPKTELTKRITVKP